MRRRFNRGKYYERMLEGKLTEVINSSNTPSFVSENVPLGSISQGFSYFDGKQELVRGQQFIKPDGTIGASGKPDPHRIFEDGIWYRTRHPAKGWRQKLCYYLSDLADRICWFFNTEVD